jgi:DNA-binding IclR family transcriptional regulator
MSQSFVSLEKALDILCDFDPETREKSAQDISASLGFPLSSTYKYLDVLLRKNFLAKNPETKKYALGRSLLQMSSCCLAGRKLSLAALDEMRALTRLTGETSMLTVRKGSEAMCLEKVESRQLLKVGMKRGAVRPLHAGGTAKMLLAHQDSPFISSYLNRIPLTRPSDETLIDCRELKKELDMIRMSGFAYSDSEVEQGVVSVGAPVFDCRKKVVAVLAIVAQKENCRKSSVAFWVQEVKRAASSISWDLKQ